MVIRLVIGNVPERTSKAMLEPPIERRTLDAQEEEILREVAADLASDIDAIAATVTHNVLARHPLLAPVDDRVATLAIQRSTVANVGAVLSTLAFGISPETIDPPDGALDLISLVAHRGDELPVLLRGYRIGGSEVRNALIRPLARRTDDVASFGRLLAVSHAHIDGYVDHLSQVICERWVELARDTAQHRERRSTALRQLLAGDKFNVIALQYPVETTHVAVALASSTEPASLDVAADTLERAMDPAPCIALDAGLDGVRVLWFGAVSSATEVAAAARSAAAGHRMHVAVSDIARGPEGFRAVRREALDTLAAARLHPPEGRVVSYSESPLAATLLADPRRAARLADTVLGPLGAETAEGLRLRQTLRAYFAADCRQAGAAAALQVHEKTVAYRLRRVAEHIGGPPQTRRAELEAALSIRPD